MKPVGTAACDEVLVLAVLQLFEDIRVVLESAMMQISVALVACSGTEIVWST
jgi:hypothetical protein